MKTIQNHFDTYKREVGAYIERHIKTSAGRRAAFYNAATDMKNINDAPYDPNDIEKTLINLIFHNPESIVADTIKKRMPMTMINMIEIAGTGAAIFQTISDKASVRAGDGRHNSLILHCLR